MNKRKTLVKALNNPGGLRFVELRGLAEAFGFRLARVSGSHHILRNPAIGEILNVQDVSGAAKRYQVRQLLALVEEYNLKLEE